jgi:ribonuclease III
MDKDLSGFEDRIGVKFKNKDLLKEALTHRSYLNEHTNWPIPHNERLEYLGDAVLELSVTEDLYKKFPDYPEGQLTVLRAALVNYQMLSKIAQEIELDKFVFMSKGEAKDIGKAREVILANAIEAVIGAIYLDQGFQISSKFIKENILKHLDEVIETKSYKDPKSELQEIIQERLKITPNYRVLEESGPAHQRIFRIGAYFSDELIAEGSGSSKQEGEVEAARNALKKYQK